jgi:hypothetical protein
MGRIMYGLALSAFVVGIAACGDGTGVQDITGTYEATQFTFTGAATGDVLAAGGSLSLTLADGGTVSGQLDVPASVGGPLQADLAGTYTVSGDTVHLSQDADTFVRDVPWIIGTDRLSASGTFDNVTITVVLERVGT